MRAIVNFYLTWKCNFTCAHCIHECGPQGNHMTTEQMDYAFGYLHWLKEHNIQVCVIGVTGGEPTLHPLFWSHFIQELAGARGEHNTQVVELHTNASVPVPPDRKILWPKFFTQVFVGHDQCHRQFKSVKDLYLQDYTDISYSVHLRHNDYPVGPFKNCISIRNKGRAAESLKNGKLIEVPCQDRPKQECIWNVNATDCLAFAFTPDHINHCGEKSHPLPPLPLEQGNIEEGQFHKYGMDYGDLWHSGMKYLMNHVGAKCSQRCMVKFARLP